jgi:predicted O-methyltransferase YrrM
MKDLVGAFAQIGIDKNYTGMDFAGYRVDLQGWNSTHPVFERVLTTCKPRTIIEVGTWKGAATVHMLKLAEKHALDVQIICVDTWLGSNEVLWHSESLRPLLNLRHGYPNLFPQFIFNMKQSGVLDRIFPLPLTSTSAARLLKRLGLTADAIYIDAGHSEDEVYADLVLYYALLRPGGVVFGDDYHHTWPGVVAAVNRFAFEQKLVMNTDAAKFVLAKPEVPLAP